MKLEQPQAIRTIFFDAGFTLLRPFPSSIDICHKVCEQLELEIDREQLHTIITSENFYFNQKQAKQGIWADEKEIAEHWIGYYTRLLSPLFEQNDARLRHIAQAINEEFAQHTSWEIYPDVEKTLNRLKSHGYTLGVISDWGAALGPILQKLKLTSYFDCLLVSAVTRFAKPSPQLYDLALQRANTIADYSLHIGDSYIYDVLGARSVGITPVLIDRTKHLIEQKIDCIVIHSLEEILDILEVSRS